MTERRVTQAQMEAFARGEGLPVASPLAGPERAAEHIRNALQLLEPCLISDPRRPGFYQAHSTTVDAAVARLWAALAQLESR
jgi:hypothetical protein